MHGHHKALYVIPDVIPADNSMPILCSCPTQCFTLRGHHAYTVRVLWYTQHWPTPTLLHIWLCLFPSVMTILVCLFHLPVCHFTKRSSDPSTAPSRSNHDVVKVYAVGGVSRCCPPCMKVVLFVTAIKIKTGCYMCRPSCTLGCPGGHLRRRCCNGDCLMAMLNR